MSLDSRAEKREDVAELVQARTLGSLIECLDDGFVRYVDHMGDDQSIVDAARISYGKGTRHVSDNTNLIRYLMRHRHTTPFEMVEFKFHVRCPMDVWRQWIRHRTASVNEYSTRYSEAIDSIAATPPEEWRLQSAINKQGSGEFLTEWPSDFDMEDEEDRAGMVSPGHYLTDLEKELHVEARRVYEERLKLGVAREQARKDLPLSTYTEAYWKTDLHNLFHFLGLRLHLHAQIEIRTYAKAMSKFVRQLVPIAWKAFEDYRLDAVTLSGPEVDCVRGLLAVGDLETVLRDGPLTKREVEEFKGKLKRMGFNVS